MIARRPQERRNERQEAPNERQEARGDSRRLKISPRSAKMSARRPQGGQNEPQEAPGGSKSGIFGFRWVSSGFLGFPRVRISLDFFEICEVFSS